MPLAKRDQVVELLPIGVVPVPLRLVLSRSRGILTQGGLLLTQHFRLFRERFNATQSSQNDFIPSQKASTAMWSVHPLLELEFGRRSSGAWKTRKVRIEGVVIAAHVIPSILRVSSLKGTVC